MIAAVFMKEDKPKAKPGSYKVPIILAFIAFCFYVTSIVMEYLNNGAAT